VIIGYCGVYGHKLPRVNDLLMLMTPVWTPVWQWLEKKTVIPEVRVKTAGRNVLNIHSIKRVTSSTVHTTALLCRSGVINVLAGPLKRRLAWLICIVYPTGCKLCARLDGGLHGSNILNSCSRLYNGFVKAWTPCYDALFSCLYFTEFIHVCVFRRAEGHICVVRWHFSIDDFLVKSRVCSIMLWRLNHRKLFPSGSSMRWHRAMTWMRHFYKRTDRPMETGCHDLL